MRKNILSALLCVAMAFAIVFSFAAVQPNAVTGTEISKDPNANQVVTDQLNDVALAPPAKDDATVPGENNDVLVPNYNTPDSVEPEVAPTEYCNWEDHVFGQPTIVMSDEYVDLYYKEEVCLCCGLQYKTSWVIRFPENITEFPKPGGIYDEMLEIVYCSDGRHLKDEKH